MVNIMVNTKAPINKINCKNFRFLTNSPKEFALKLSCFIDVAVNGLAIEAFLTCGCLATI